MKPPWVTLLPSARWEDQQSVPRSVGIVGLYDSGHLMTSTGVLQ